MMKKLFLFSVLYFSLFFGEGWGEAAFAQCIPTTATAHLDINNVDALIMNGGDMWWDRGLGTAQYKVPKVGGVSTEFAGALWIGGIDGAGQLHVAAQTYRQQGNDYFAGPLDATGQTTPTIATDYDKIWKVNLSDIQIHVANATHNLINTPTSVLEWPAEGNPYAKGNGGVPLTINRPMAPYTDVDGISGYDPMGGDYPQICGDQALWFIYNDNGNTHTQCGCLPLKVEVQVMAYAFIGSGYENSTTFYSYKIINRSTNVYDSTYFAFWNDPDLGCANDDYLGCDSTRNMGIIYNADTSDQPCPVGYGTNIPMTGAAMIQPPKDANNVDVNMSGFYYYYNSTPPPQSDPNTCSGYYGYMTGTWKDGSHFTQGGDGHLGTTNTNYVYPSSPNDAAGWNMCHPVVLPGDLRTVQSFGKFHFIPNQEIKFTYAVTSVFGITYPCPSYAPIQTAMDYVKAYFYNNACDNVLSMGVPSTTLRMTDKIKVFPNPASSLATISLSKKINGTIIITNTLGQTVHRAAFTGDKHFVNTATFAKGVYFISINNKGKMMNDKLVVE